MLTLKYLVLGVHLSKRFISHWIISLNSHSAVCHISSLLRLSLSPNDVLGPFPHVYSCCAFTPNPISYILIYSICFFTWTNVLTYEWWWDLWFSNKNNLHQECLINSTFFMHSGSCKQANAETWSIFPICKTHMVQNYSPTPLTRVRPKDCTCHFTCCLGLRFQHWACVAIVLTVMWYVRNEVCSKQVVLCCICWTIWHDIDLGN